MFWQRLVNGFRPRRVDRDIQRELEFHITDTLSTRSAMNPSAVRSRSRGTGVAFPSAGRCSSR
jgi:hypothetical protein